MSCARLAQGVVCGLFCVVCGLFWVVLDLDAAKKWMSATPSALTPHSAPTPADSRNPRRLACACS